MSLNFLVNKEVVAHNSDIFSIVVDGDTIITTSGDNTIKTWNLHTQDLKSSIDAFTGGGHHLAAANGKCIGVSFTGELKVVGGDDIKVTTLPWSISLSPDATTLAATTATGALQVYDLTSSTLVATINTRGSFGMCSAYAANNQIIASGHADGGVYTFDTISGKLAHSLVGHLHTVRSVAFSPSSELIASAGDGKRILIHDVKSAECIASFAGHTSSITALDWNATREYLLSASLDGKLKIWNFETREACGTFTENTGHKIWSLKWVRQGPAKVEGFVVGGSEKVLKFYLPTSN